MIMNKKSLFSVLLMIIFLIIIIIGIHSVLNKNNEENSSEPLTYVLKQHKNSIAVFIKGQNEPYLTLNVSFNNLPFEDKQLLINGIHSNDLSEIMKYAEDYDG